MHRCRSFTPQAGHRLSRLCYAGCRFGPQGAPSGRLAQASRRSGMQLYARMTAAAYNAFEGALLGPRPAGVLGRPSCPLRMRPATPRAPVTPPGGPPRVRLAGEMKVNKVKFKPVDVSELKEAHKVFDEAVVTVR